MIAYHIALFVHLVALLAAAATSSVVHLAAGRARNAGTVAEIQQWQGLAGRTARNFPIATLTLFASGVLMVSVQPAWSWHAGWVVAGIVGVAYLLAAGAVLGIRGARAGATLAGLGAGDLEPARSALRDPVAAALSWVNTGVALAVVYTMAAKPGLVASGAALLIGGMAGLARHVLSTRRVTASTIPAARPELAA